MRSTEISLYSIIVPHYCLRTETGESSPGVDKEERAERLQSLESERVRRHGEEKGLKNLGYSLLNLILCKSLTDIDLVEKVKTAYLGRDILAGVDFCVCHFFVELK